MPARVHLPLSFELGDPTFYDRLSPAVAILGHFGEDEISRAKQLQYNGDNQAAFQLVELALENHTDSNIRQDALEIKHGMLYDAGQHEEAIMVLGQIQDEYLIDEDFCRAAEAGRRIGRSYRDMYKAKSRQTEFRDKSLLEYTQAEDLLASAYEHKRLEIEDRACALRSKPDDEKIERISIRHLETLREHLYALPLLFPASDQLFLRLAQAEEIYKRSLRFETKGQWGQKQQAEITDRLDEFKAATKTRKRFGSFTIAKLLES